MTKNFFKITEKWIKDRINYTGENLEDIKTLSLPGNYKEKITHLGTSLLHFSRLKELDLSRNSLVTLEGLQHLQCLEVLNLYFNQIATLDELCKLRANSKLQSLDVRLNPLGRNEPDYRLYVIHMLTNLTHLDDRRVLDDERRAALMNFSTDVAKEFHQNPDGDTQLQRITSTKFNNSSVFSEEALHAVDPKHHPTLRKSHPRVQLVERWRPFSYSEEIPALSENEQMVSSVNSTSRSAKPYHDVTERLKAEETFNWKTDNPPSASMESTLRNSSNKNNIPAVHFDDESSTNDVEHQTTTLSSRFLECSDPMNVLESRCNYKSNWQSVEHNVHCSLPGDVKSELIWQEESATIRLCLLSLCDLVDRYWNGRRSLHGNVVFLPAALKVLHEYLDVKTIDSDASQSAKHVQHKPIPLSSKQAPNHSMKMESSPLTSSNHNDKERKSEKKQLMASLHQELMRMKNENQILLKQLQEHSVVSPSLKKKVSISEPAPYSKDEFEQMRLELGHVRMRMQGLEQIAEMANMLKESHKSLMETNRQLMNELKEARSDPLEYHNQHSHQHQPASSRYHVLNETCHSKEHSTPYLSAMPSQSTHVDPYNNIGTPLHSIPTNYLTSSKSFSTSPFDNPRLLNVNNSCVTSVQE